MLEVKAVLNSVESTVKGFRMAVDQFCLKWNNFQTSIITAFESLQSTEDLADVTLTCEGLNVKAHKIILSACSTYFRSVFKENPCPHPIVILKDILYVDLLAILNFMYHGEVLVMKDQLQSFLQTAEVLQVSGLIGCTNFPIKNVLGPVKPPPKAQKTAKPPPDLCEPALKKTKIGQKPKIVQFQKNISSPSTSSSNENSALSPKDHIALREHAMISKDNNTGIFKDQAGFKEHTGFKEHGTFKEHTGLKDLTGTKDLTGIKEFGGLKDHTGLKDHSLKDSPKHSPSNSPPPESFELVNVDKIKVEVEIDEDIEDLEMCEKPKIGESPSLLEAALEVKDNQPSILERSLTYSSASRSPSGPLYNLEPIISLQQTCLELPKNIFIPRKPPDSLENEPILKQKLTEFSIPPGLEISAEKLTKTGMDSSEGFQGSSDLLLMQDIPAHHSSQCGNCPHCGKIYSNQSALKYHVRLVHSDLTNMYCCHLCPESFDYREGYKKHMVEAHNVRN